MFYDQWLLFWLVGHDGLAGNADGSIGYERGKSRMQAFRKTRSSMLHEAAAAARVEGEYRRLQMRLRESYSSLQWGPERMRAEKLNHPLPEDLFRKIHDFHLAERYQWINGNGERLREDAARALASRLRASRGDNKPLQMVDLARAREPAYFSWDYVQR